MSVIRNSRASSNQTLTIKRFLSSEAFNSEGLYPREYIELNNKYMTCQDMLFIHTGTDTTFIIKCEFASSARGTLFGAPDGLRIVKTATPDEIKWYKGDTLLYTKAREDGPHLFGFITTTINNVSGIYPSYDGIVPEEASYVPTAPLRAFIPGSASTAEQRGLATGSGLWTTGSWAVKLYEIMGLFKYVSSGGATSNIILHWYAATNSSATAVQLYDTRANGYRSGSSWYSNYTLSPSNCESASGVTPSAGIGGTVTYGVQLHDLKIAFSSPYKDLMAIVCQDGGNPEAWADPVDKITNGTTTRNMAFRMAGGSGSSVSASMPLPENYYVSRSGTYTFIDQEKGELIYGRYPKWNIWNDKLKFGLFVDMKDANTYVMRFNIFKDFNGDIMTPSGGSLSDARFDLIRFDGYSHHSNDAHAPILTSPSNITVFEHNTVQCLCNSESIMGGVIGGSMPDSSHPTVTERYCVFFKTDSALGAVGYRAGNLIPWNYAASELTEKIYGVTAKAAFADGTVIFDSDTKQNTPLDKNTASNIKALYQERIVVEDFSLRPGFAGYIYKNKNASAENRKLNVNIALLFSTASSSPSSLKQIDCSRLIPKKTCSFEVKEDGNDSLTAWASTSEKYRLVVETDEQIGVLIGDYYYGTKLNMVDTFEPTNAYNQSSGLVLGIAPINSNHTIEEQGYTYMFAVTIFTYFGNKYHLYNIVDESLTFSELETYYSGGSQPYNDPNLAVKYYGEALSGNSTKHIQSGDVSTRNNITASQFKTYGRFFAIYDHEIDPLTVGVNHISDQTTVVVNVAKKANAPIYCALDGGWNTDTQTIVDESISGYAVQSPYYLSKLDYSGDYIYEDLYMFYNVSGSTYTPRSTIPSMFEAQLFKNGEFAAEFNEEVLSDNGYTLSISWQEASRYEGFMLLLNGGMANGGLFVANIAFSGTKQRGDYYKLKFTSIS